MTRAANPLDIRTTITQVQEALVDVIDLAYRYRYPAAADLRALAAVAADKLPDRALIFVLSEGTVYRWRPASLLPAVLPYVVQPTILPRQGNGRWERQSSSVTLGPAYFRPLHRVATGYARAVQIYQGEDDDVLERIYAQRPAFLVEWLSDKLTCKSYRHGAIYEYDLRFSVHCVSRNLRNGPDGVIGSSVGSDEGAVPDPGLYQMIGDIRYLLGGSTLGLDPGVMFTDVTGGAQIVETELAQRLYRAELDVLVKGSVHVVDEDLIENPEIWIERRDAGTPPGESFDASNCVAAGYRFGPQRGLVAAPSPGVAYIGSALVASAPGAHTFAPNARTYRDLYPSGRILYQAVAPTAEPPPQPPTTLRLGFTDTSGSDIVSDTLTCSYSLPSGADPGEPFRAA